MYYLFMQNNYFTPKIEDIRIGYEWEWNLGTDDKPRWQKYIMSDKLIPADKNPNPDWEIIRYFLDSNRIRVSYLTKDQIEAEGWRCIHWREYLWEKGDRIIHFSNGQKEDEYDTKYLSVFKIHNSSNILFKGQCKDLNTFRYICKLLNI